MEKITTKARSIQFFSKKNASLISVSSEFARDYARLLENDISIAAYEAQIPVDSAHLQSVSRVDIRAAYFGESWCSDFKVTYTDGTNGIRELIHEDQLGKLAAVEKLELSRRYWTSIGVRDWRLVVVEG